MDNLSTTGENAVAGFDHEFRNKPGFERLKKIWKRDKYLLFMSLPGVILVIVFKYVPIYGVVMAFQNFNPAKGFWGSEWVGFNHFRTFFNDPFAWRITKNTVLLSLYGLFWGFPAPILLALMLNEVRKRWFKRAVQTITYLPYFISIVIVIGMMKDLLSPFNGIVNVLLHDLFGIKPINFFAESGWFRTLYISSGIWQGIGFSSILYLAALSGIDESLYEAAYIDGATRWQRIRFVTLPGIKPTIIILLILSMGSLLDSDFAKVLLMYNPGTYETSDVISTYIFRSGIEGGNYSYSAAVGLLLSVVAFLFVWSTNYMSRKTNETSLW